MKDKSFIVVLAVTVGIIVICAFWMFQLVKYNPAIL